MKSKPLISVILSVKNGMPYVKSAVDSLAAQTYKNFELIVQDANSTDGTIEYLKSYKGIKNFKIKSEPDSGREDGWNRALKRTGGDIIGSLESDNLLAIDALQKVVEAYKKHPEAAAIYGGAQLIDQNSNPIYQRVDFKLLVPFDTNRFLKCQLVPPFSATFFSKKYKKYLQIGPSVKSCGDFQIWLNFCRLSIIAMPQVFTKVRVHKNSATYNARNYDQFCRDKIELLTGFFSKFNKNIILENLYKECVSGVYAWAAKSTYEIEGESARFRKYTKMALKFYPYANQSYQLETLR